MPKSALLPKISIIRCASDDKTALQYYLFACGMASVLAKGGGGYWHIAVNRRFIDNI